MIKEAENVCHQCADAAKTARANDFADNLSKEALYQVGQEEEVRVWCK